MALLSVLCLTESFQSVGHGLVLHHVDESSAQTEVREDQEDVLQDVVDSSDLLQRLTLDCGCSLQRQQGWRRLTLFPNSSMTKVEMLPLMPMRMLTLVRTT